MSAHVASIAVAAGYLVGISRWRLVGLGLVACVFLLLKDDTPGGQFSDLPVMITALALYLALIGLIAAVLYRREWWRAAMIVTVTVAWAVVPHLLGRAENARIEAMVLDAAVVPVDLDLAGANLVILGGRDRGSEQLIERFDFASVHVTSFRTRPLEPLRLLSEIPLPSDAAGPADYILTSSHSGRFSENYPLHAGLPPELAGYVWEEAYLFDATTWPEPESLIARQVVAHRRVPALGLPWMVSGQVALGLDQTGLPLFCAVERSLRRICRP